MGNTLRARWRRSLPWRRLSTALLLGGSAGAVAQVWLPAPWAAAVGSTILTLLGLGTAGSAADVQDRRLARRMSVGRLLLINEHGRPSRVKDADDPVVVGVHPVESTTGPAACTVPAIPRYIARDIDTLLHSAVHEGGFVLLLGDSSAGKTRAAYEAIRLLTPDHFFLAPTGRDGIQPLMSLVRPGGRYIVWLDDVERFIGPDGLTAVRLQQLLQGDSVVVIATMRTHEYDRYSAFRESAHGPDQREVWRSGRDVLRLARKIQIMRRWSPQEQERACFHQDDPRVAKAIMSADRFGIAESLAAGPALVEAWRNGCAPGAQPRGAAVVQAAVDVRRSGVHTLLPTTLLLGLHLSYLEEFGGAELRAESVEDALRWASQPATGGGAASMLLGDQTIGFRAFDYLIDSLADAPVPEKVWSALLSWAGPDDALDMGLSALASSQLDRAEAAFRAAAAARRPAAEVGVAVVLGKKGRVDQAVEILSPFWEERARSLGPSAPDTLDAHAQLAYWTAKQGEGHTALGLLTSLLTLRENALGLEHPDTLATELQIANLVGALGDSAEATRRCRLLLPRFERSLGAEHLETLDVRARIALWTGRSGDPETALRLSLDLLEQRTRLLGPDHGDTLFTRGRIVSWTAAIGRPREALALAHQLAADRARVLGPTSLHTLHSRRQTARLIAVVDGPAAATSCYQQLLSDHNNQLGPDHPLTRKVASRLTQILGS